MSKKALFIDRDGVINVEKNYLYKIEDFEFLDGVFEKLKEFYDCGYYIFIITNQSGINRGYYTKDDFLKLTKWMEDEFLKQKIKITKVYYCPHTPSDNCSCRKPNIGMIKQACNKFDIDIQNSILIGDKNSDIQAGINAGIKTTILVKTGHKIDENNSNATYIFDNLKDIKIQC